MKSDEYHSFIQSFVKERLQKCNLELSNDKSKSIYEKSAASLQNKYKLTNEEMKLKTHLKHISKSQLDDIRIVKYPNEILHNILYLEAPKKIISYYVPSASSNSSMIGLTNTNIVKKRNTKQKVAANAQNTNQNMNVVSNSVSNNSTSFYITIPPSKKGKHSHDIDNNEEEIVSESVANKILSRTMTISMSKSKSSISSNSIGRLNILNFYPIIQQIFDYFYDLEYDKQEINFAFFARITSKNCKDFQLSHFADESTCLAVIKVRFQLLIYLVSFDIKISLQDRLRDKSYTKAEDFRQDFDIMFENIITYYPQGHEAISKAKELQKIFYIKWNEAINRYK